MSDSRSAQPSHLSLPARVLFVPRHFDRCGMSLENVRIVLVQPEFPGNIGSTARAMQTMGLSQLYLVRPACNPRADEAYWLATSASELLERATIVDRLEDALADTVYSVATTRRTRRQGYPIYTPEEAAQLVLDRSVAQPAAIVFGRESSGLTNPELALCSVNSSIPAATPTVSLNLAQSVMLYAYAVYQASLRPAERSHHWNLATHVELERFYQQLAAAFEQSGMKPATTMENYVARFRRVLGRVPLESRDLRLLHRLMFMREPRRTEHESAEDEPC